MVTITVVSGVAAELEAANLAFLIGGLHLSFSVGVEVDAAIDAVIAGARSNLVIDGFPRTVEAAERLDAALAHCNLRVSRFILASLSRDALIEAHALRRKCPSSSCGAVYHLRAMRPRQFDVCDVCGSVGLLPVFDDVEDSFLPRALASRRESVLLQEHYRSVVVDVIEDDPFWYLSAALAEMQAHLLEAKKQTAIVIADERRLSKRIAEARQTAADSQKSHQAAAVVAECEELVTRYEQQLLEQSTSAEQMRRELLELNSRVEEFQRRKNLLVAIRARKEAEEKIMRLMWSASHKNDSIE